jgi:hypothetical protein
LIELSRAIGTAQTKGSALSLAAGAGRFTADLCKNFEVVVSTDILIESLKHQKH